MARSQQSIAYFISPHGFGHATRACAVMEAVQRLYPELRFEIFTQTPAWLFAESLPGPFGYHSVLTDIGLVQKDSLTEDMAATVAQLNQLLPFDPPLIQKLAEQVTALGCRLVLCDIAPMGIAVARQAGIPAVLIENFTWDWIYQGYNHNGQLSQQIDYLDQLFAAADYHIQTEPVCQPKAVDLTTHPVSRRLRQSPAEIRRNLGVDEGAKLVLLTMGGMDWDYGLALRGLKAQPGLVVVVPENGSQPAGQVENLITLSRNSGIFHPDLVNACDAVIGKVGYSTLAEVYRAGVPFGYVERPSFPEASILVDHIKTNMQGLRFLERELQNGSWLTRLPALLALPSFEPNGANGADQIASFVSDLLKERRYL